MNRKILYIAYSVLFTVICFIPFAFMPFAESEESTENRKLSEFPKLITEEGKFNSDWSKEFDTYFSEHFAFRNKLVNLNNTLMKSVFNSSGEDDVIIGKDDWLYYSYTADDFMGTNQMKQWEINDIAHTIKLMQDYSNQKGSKMIFVGVPNKNTIYPEYMPYNYLENPNQSDLERLEAALDTAGAEYCSVQELFENQKSLTPDELLYHKTDTHWNNYGAYTAYEKFASVLEIEPISLSKTGISDTWEGDLQKMLFPDSDFLDEQVEYDFAQTYNYIGRFKGLDDINIRTGCEGKNGSLLMFRDSFGEAILPYLAESVGTAAFSRAVPYKMNMLEQEQFDSIILEIVERNLRNLRVKAPEMPSPEYEEITNKIISEKQICTAEAVQNMGYLKIYGAFTEDIQPEKIGNTYVVVNGKTYEAFPVFEAELLNEDGDGRKGYSVNIWDENVQEAEIIAVIDGEYVSGGTVKINVNGEEQ